jgi:hypothetical protein
LRKEKTIMPKVSYEEWLKQNTEFVEFIYKSSREDIAKEFWETDQHYEESDQNFEKLIEIIDSYKKLISNYEKNKKEYDYLLQHIETVGTLNKDKPKINFAKILGLMSDTEGAIQTLNKIAETLFKRKKALHKGRQKANDDRAKNASEKSSVLEKAVADYLDKAKKDGLNTTNKTIVAAFQKMDFRTQLKQANGKAYTDLTFKRDVELAAAKWRNLQKQTTK